MPAYSNIQPLYNLLSPPINRRFAVHLAALGRSSQSPSATGHRNPASPIHQDYCCRLFDGCLTFPLPQGRPQAQEIEEPSPADPPSSVVSQNGRGIGGR